MSWAWAIADPPSQRVHASGPNTTLRNAIGCCQRPAASNHHRGATIRSRISSWGFRNERIVVVAVFGISLGLIIADAITPVELNLPAAYALPLVLAAAARKRRLLWLFTALLTVATFVVYAWKIPAGGFTLREAFFVNRVLAAMAFVVTAGLLHVWMASAETSEDRRRQIEEQGHKLEVAKATRRQVEVQEAERRALAGQLHDLVGQNLAGLSINLNVVKSQLSLGDGSRIGDRLNDSLGLVEETIESIRDVMAELRPAVLDDYGLTAGLRWYAEKFSSRTGVPTAVIERGPSRRLTPPAEAALFRIAQEALANTAKYAEARNAAVAIETKGESVSLVIEDDGRGFDQRTTPQPVKDHGWGLMIMRERAEAVGGQLTVESEPGSGTRVIVTLRGGAP
jgi:signal transduction histidine kinase